MFMFIQIPRWLIKPKIWRYVCLASSIVGLLCYALSSSFNHLFGKWNWWKILVYSIFSLIISIAILFAKTWQRSNSLRVKANLAFLVLIITCVYSFLFDKVVKGKPDAYSLISCAAFAIMSLSLSRQTHCGVEIDLLYFFSGSLTVQLMKIKLWLVVVGASFCYFLIILRSSLDAPPSAHLRLQIKDQIIIEVDSDPEDAYSGSAIQVTSDQSDASIPIMTFDAPLENENLRVQERIPYQANSITQQLNNDISLIMPQLMSSIKALKKKNKKVIRMVSKHVDEFLKAMVESKTRSHGLTKPTLHTVDVNLVMDSLPTGAVNNLRQAVKLMVGAGFEKECCEVYISWRREFLQECLWRCGSLFASPYSPGEESKIGEVEIWTRAFNVAVRILFPNERRLCDRVFFGLSSAADISFAEVCWELTIRLLSFTNTYLTGSHSWRLLCHIIRKVDETLCDLLPEFESLFSDEYIISIKDELQTVRKSLGEAIRDFFIELEKLISSDMQQTVVPPCNLCPILFEVRRYLMNISDASHIILKKHLEEDAMAHDRDQKSLFSTQIARIIELLVRNLEANSVNYTDPALGYVYMMNNLRLIELWTTDRPLGDLLDNDWILNFTAKIKQNILAQYQRSSWNKVLDFLKLEDVETMEPSVAAVLMKDKLDSFNLQFDEICSAQCTWSVFDKPLKEEIITSLENIILPAYGNFIGRFQDFLGNQAFEYIKYGMLDLQDQLSRLFLVSDGNVLPLPY